MPVRSIRVEGDVAYVPLTQGYEAIIDAADVPLVAGHNWYAWKPAKVVYAVRNAKSHEPKGTIRMHRVIVGAAGAEQVEHRSCDGLDNRRRNLRYSSQMENCYNRRARSDNTSGVKGVYWSRWHMKWCSYITAGGVRTQLGYFVDKDEAAAAYAKASAELHGDFGRTA